jgi:hypothetical protein
LIQLLIFCLVFGLIWWVLQQLPLPQPFARIASVVVIVIACIMLIYMLMGLLGTGTSLRLR